MKTKYTPGPWVVKNRNEITAGGEEIAFTAMDVDEAEANARLITAAPEMLEALKLCREAIWKLSPTGNDEEYSKAWVKACAEVDQRCKTLIARIEGGGE